MDPILPFVRHPAAPRHDAIQILHARNADNRLTHWGGNDTVRSSGWPVFNTDHLLGAHRLRALTCQAAHACGSGLPSRNGARGRLDPHRRAYGQESADPAS